MKNHVLKSLILSLFCGSVLAQVDKVEVQLTGKIDKYPIEVAFNSFNRTTGELEGVYRYAGKRSYIQLKGQMVDRVIYLEESYKNEITGVFYLEENEKELTGTWISGSGNKSFDVTLNTNDNTFFPLSTKSLEEISELNEVSADLTGSYGVEFYWINDMWFSEETKQLELGFNGGFAVLEQLGTDSLHFQVEVICGPTYHFAMSDGIAYLKDTAYIYTNEDGCEISITGGGKRARLSANMSFECGFGARAFLDHEFIKITDEPLFGENTSLEALKQKE